MGRYLWFRLLALVLLAWLGVLVVSRFVLPILPDLWQRELVWAISILATVIAVLGNLAQAFGLFESTRQRSRATKPQIVQLQEQAEESEQIASREVQAEQTQKGVKKSKQRIT
jgi:cell shape-determining protein MreC